MSKTERMIEKSIEKAWSQLAKNFNNPEVNKRCTLFIEQYSNKGGYKSA